jgi:serine/threonine protein kinase
LAAKKDADGMSAEREQRNREREERPEAIASRDFLTTDSRDATGCDSTRDSLSHSSFLFSDEGLLDLMGNAGLRLIASPLYECRVCERLVDSQVHRGVEVTPRFCPWCGERLQPVLGRELDGYRLDELLSRGGFGAIYLASNLAQPRMKAVVKILWPRLAYRRPELAKIFVEEARLTEEVGQTCWNVVRVFNVREKPWPYYFMEYVRGTTLDALLRDRGADGLPIDEAKGYLRGIAKAIAATHARGRVHRDLKPLNVMVVESDDLSFENRIKLLDFGLATRIASAKAAPNNLAAGEIEEEADAVPSEDLTSAGTPEYMAPEAFDGLHEYAGDIYSFGVTAYEILTGEGPWSAEPAPTDRWFHWREVHKSRAPRPLKELRADVPGRLARAVMACLEKDPARRTPSAAALIDELADPLPRWIVGVGTAGVVLVALLVLGLVFRSKTPLTPKKWVIDGESRESAEVEIWTGSARELVGRSFALEAGPDLPITSGRTSNPALRLGYDAGRLVLDFDGNADLESLLDSRIEVAADGDGFSVSGTVWIRLDDKPPILREVFVADRGTSDAIETRRAFVSGERLDSRRAILLVEADEAHVRDVRFIIPGPSRDEERRLEGVPSSLSPAARPPLWKIDLRELGPGAHRGSLEIRDGAGHSARRQVEFIVDHDVGLALLGGPQDRRIHGRKVFFELRAQEALSILRVRRAERDREVELPWVPIELDDRGGNPSEPYLRVAQLREPGSGPIALSEGSKILLGVPADASRRVAFENDAFEIDVADAVFPPNTASIRLEWRVPRALDDADVIGASALVGEGAPIEFERVRGAPGTELRVERALSASIIDRLEIECAPGRVERVTCDRDGQSHESERTADRFTLSAIPVDSDGERPSVENEIEVTLIDPLGRQHVVRWSFETDVRAPRLDLYSRSLDSDDPRDHRVQSWSEIDLWVQADEPLESASCRIGSSDLPVRPDSENRRIWRFDPSELPAIEGRHDAYFSARDLAGNRTTEMKKSIVLNTDPPKVEVPKERLREGILELIENIFVFVASDGNELRYDDAEILLWVGGSRTPRRYPIEPPSVSGGLHEVRLDSLLEACEGLIEVRLADTFGRRPERKDVRWRFRYEPRGIEPRDVIPDYRGFAWARVRSEPGGSWFYVTRTEVTIGAYQPAVATGLVDPPRYWSDSGEPPEFRRSGSVVSANDLPVTGISPLDAETFARRIGADLPSWEEWRAAAWRENPNEELPWKLRGEGAPFVNCHGSWDPASASALLGKHVDRIFRDRSGGSGVSRVVDAAFDSFVSCPPELRKRLNYSGDIVHLIGNVGELVRLEGDPGKDAKPEAGAGWGIAGGDFDTNYDSINLRAAEPQRRFERPDAMTGFRLVMRLESAPEGFRAAAFESDER